MSSKKSSIIQCCLMLASVGTVCLHAADRMDLPAAIEDLNLDFFYVDPKAATGKPPAAEPYAPTNSNDLKFTETVGQNGTILLGHSNFTQIKNAPSANYRLVEDIHLNHTGPWSPVPSFTGRLDGYGHIIYGLNISESAANINSGLFRKCSNAVFTDIGFINFHLENSGKATNAGLIAGVCNKCVATGIVCSDGYMRVEGGNDFSGHYSTLGILFGRATETCARFAASRVMMDGGKNSVLGGGIGIALSCELDGALERVEQQADCARLGMGSGHSGKGSNIRVAAHMVTQNGTGLVSGIGTGDNQSKSTARVVVNQASQSGLGRFGVGAGISYCGGNVYVAACNSNQTSSGLWSCVGVGVGDARYADAYMVGSGIQQKITYGEATWIGGGSAIAVNANVHSFLHHSIQNSRGKGGVGGGAGDLGRPDKIKSPADASNISAIIQDVKQIRYYQTALGGGVGIVDLPKYDTYRSYIELLLNGLQQSGNSKNRGNAYGHLWSKSEKPSYKVVRADKPSTRQASKSELGFIGPWITGNDTDLPMLSSLDGIFQDLERLSEPFAEAASEYAPPGDAENSIMSGNNWRTQSNRLPFPDSMAPCLVQRAQFDCGFYGFACYTDGKSPTGCKPAAPPVMPSPQPTGGPQPTGEPEPCHKIFAKPLFQTLDQSSGQIYVVAFQYITKELLLVRYLDDGTLDTHFGECGRRRWPMPELTFPFSVTAGTANQSDNEPKIDLILQDDDSLYWLTLVAGKSNLQPFDLFQNSLEINALTIAGKKHLFTGSADDQFVIGDSEGLFRLENNDRHEAGYALLNDQDGSLYVAGKQGDNVLILKFDLVSFEPDTTFGNTGLRVKSFDASARADSLLLTDGRLLVAGNINRNESNLFLMAYTPEGYVDSSFTAVLENTTISTLDATTQLIASKSHIYVVKYTEKSSEIVVFTYDHMGNKIDETVKVLFSQDFLGVAPRGLALNRISGTLWFAVEDGWANLFVSGIELPHWSQGTSSQMPSSGSPTTATASASASSIPPDSAEDIPIWIGPAVATGALMTIAGTVLPFVVCCVVIHFKSKNDATELSSLHTK